MCQMLSLASEHPFQVNSSKDCLFSAKTVQTMLDVLSKESLPNLQQANWIHKLLTDRVIKI